MKLWREPFDKADKAITPGIVIIDNERCKGCGYCVEYCPREALAMSEKTNLKGYNLAEVVDETRCVNCGLCEVLCPEFAVKLLSSENKS